MGVITISGLPGALGEDLAAALAEQLHYRLVDRSELMRSAQQLVTSDLGWECSPELRERPPSFRERFSSERLRYASLLRRMTIDFAQQDDTVIVGLGAGQFLRGLRQVLRVLVVAPEEVRMERIMECGFEQTAGPLTRAQARDLQHRRERESAAYIRDLFHVGWLEPSNWDLVLNTGSFSVVESAQLVSRIVEAEILEPGATDRRRLADVVLASRVESALRNNRNVWVDDLRVEAHEGRVCIEGVVFTEDERNAVKRIACSVDGVQAFESDLRFQPLFLAGR